MQVEKWSVVSGDYVEDQLNDDPYEVVKRNRKMKKIVLNILYSLVTVGVLLLVLIVLSNFGSKH